jgi:sigma-E factor negative regulatory protein RseB
VARVFDRWVRTAAAVGCLVPALAAAQAVAPGAEAKARLARLHQAALQQNYQGTMVFSAAGVLSSSRVAHYAVGDQSYELIEALDGRQQKIVRHNELVYTLWPQSNVAVLERRERLGSRGTLLQTVETRALEQYELRVEGRERIAGREAEVILLQPRDAWRYAQRLWADLSSGLMLRSDVLTHDRQVLESSAFSLIEIGVRPQPEAVTQPIQRLGSFRLLRARHEQAQLETEGWTLARPLPGFVQSSCVRRPVEAQSEDSPARGEHMVQAVFSDGLAHVSLFIERYDAKRHRKELQSTLGATSTLMQRRGDHWITVMGDVPPGTLRQLLDSLERRR